jgi:regulator of RNase E activity RraB
MKENFEDDGFFNLLNAKVIENLEICGGDPDIPYEVEFFLYFHTEEDSYRAAAIIQKAGYNVELSYNATNSEWLCQPTKKVVPNSTNINKMTRFLRRVAKSFRGKYDGWGTLVD